MKKLVLSIPNPCHQSWDDMAPGEKGKFCAACQKTVIDFSQMSDGQLAAFFRKPAGAFCGRFHEDQLQREIMIPAKKIPWVKYFFQIAIPAFLVSIKAYSQKAVSQKHVIQTVTEAGTDSEKKKLQSLLHMQKIKGQVTDSSGNPVPYATVSVSNTVNSTAADGMGNFELDVNMEDEMIDISAIGYQPVKCRIEKDFLAITMKQNSIDMEPVIIVSQERFVLGGGMAGVRSLQPYPTIREFLDTVFSPFTVYPNPVARNSVISIRANKVAEGNYLATIFDGKGAIIQISSLSFQEDGKAEMPIGNVASGSYFLHLRNKKTGKQYTRKLIVQ